MKSAVEILGHILRALLTAIVILVTPFALSAIVIVTWLWCRKKV